MNTLLSQPLPSYHGLCAQLDLDQGIPFVDQWSAEADFLQLIVDYTLNKKPKNIVECGSGLTTLMLARACQINQAGSVVSLENGKEYADKTNQVIEFYGLSDFAHVLYAPLEAIEIEGHSYQWYSLADLKVERIDQLVIDGPPGFLQKHSRYPALPLLKDKLSQSCGIFLDDASRDDELEIVRHWQEKFPEHQFDYPTTIRGCARSQK